MIKDKTNRVCELFNIKYPIIQAGMVWCSGWRLASAVSNAGGLGIIGAGSMHPETLSIHIDKCRITTDKPFAVNVPLIYPEIEKLMAIIEEKEVKIVFTSAGNPSTWTSKLKRKGITVVHVVSSLRFALKAENAGVDAVVGEGFEAGGHNGREETTTMCLIPSLSEHLSIPVIAAGGIGDGKSMLAAFALGAEGVQVGSRFAASLESSAHENFKTRITQTEEGDTVLTLKELTPVRLLKNQFYDGIQELYLKQADTESLKLFLGRGRSKKGIFEGDLENGELEIGQISARIKNIKPAKDVLDDIWQAFIDEKQKMNQWP